MQLLVHAFYVSSLQLLGCKGICTDEEFKATTPTYETLDARCMQAVLTAHHCNWLAMPWEGTPNHLSSNKEKEKLKQIIFKLTNFQVKAISPGKQNIR